MARPVSKAADNMFCQARIRASSWNKVLTSRFGAAGLLGIDESTLAKIELGTTKVVAVDIVMMMADVYNAPELLNYYCAQECPLARHEIFAQESDCVDESIVKLLCSLKPEKCGWIASKLLDIGEDNKITPDEIPDCEEIIKSLDQISKAASALKINVEKAMKNEK